MSINYLLTCRGIFIHGAVPFHCQNMPKPPPCHLQYKDRLTLKLTPFTSLHRFIHVLLQELYECTGLFTSSRNIGFLQHI